MPDGPLIGLLDESASLWHVVHSIERHVNELTDSHTYTGATKELFRYVGDLAASTKRLLETNARAEEPSTRGPARLTVETLRGYWIELHRRVQPAGEAHSLSAPAALIELAAAQMRKIPGLDQSKVVVSLSPDLMYFQDTHTNLSILGKQLERTLPDVNFPRQLGFVSLPYSQGPSLFANLILYHELGHFAFEELSSTNPLLNELDDRLVAIITGQDLQPDQAAYVLEMLRDWTQEIFCDLFALHLVGPAFSFAAIELFSLLDILEESVARTFQPTHPAPACRFRVHVEYLKSAGWWDQLNNLTEPTKNLLERLAKEPESGYLLIVDQDHITNHVLVTEFLKVLPLIENAVRQITQAVRAEPLQYSTHRKHIETCLMNGVVPSVAEAPGETTATPVAVINGCYIFYLTSLEKLMKRLKRDPHEIKDRSLWKQRIEMWTQKALEDIQLLNQRET